MKRPISWMVLALALMCWISEPSASASESASEHGWFEIGADIGYQKTNFWFKDKNDFGISFLEARGGYRFFLNPWLFIDPFLDVALLADLGRKEQNEFFWNNNWRYGPGLRLRSEYRIENEPNEEHGVRFNYANLDYYVEYLHISFIDRGHDIPDNIPENDFRTGLNSWIAADSNSKFYEGGFRGGLWFEMWSDLAYHTTNFYLEGKDNFLLLTLSPKIGLRGAYYGIALEPYYRLDYVQDLLNEDWNKEAWSNNTKYGPGLRLSLGGLTQRTDTNIYLYAEYLEIYFPSRVGQKAAGLSADDFRAGLNLWIPFGASKGSQGRR